MALTVKQLRQALKGVDGEMRVYTSDHDHSEFETNGIASHAFVEDQSNADEHSMKYLNSKKGEMFKIKGKYFVIKV